MGSGSSNNSSKPPDNFISASIDELTEKGLYEFLNRTEGRNWLRTSNGLNWLGTEKSIPWLLSDAGCAWYTAYSSERYRRHCDGHLLEWLLSDSNRHILYSKRGYELLSVSKALLTNDWARSAEGLSFIISTEGNRWLCLYDYTWLLRSVSWMCSNQGKEFLLSDNGSEFIEWYIEWKKTRKGRDWLLTDDGCNWIRNNTDDHIFFVIVSMGSL